MDNPSMIVISCAGDAELAEKINSYLLAAAKMDASIVDDEIEIADDNVDKEMTRDLLQSYVVDKLEGYSVTEFGDVFVIGIKTDPDKFMRYRCEYCNYPTAFYADLHNHRILHAGYLYMPTFL